MESQNQVLENEKEAIETCPILTLKNAVVFPETLRSLFFNRPQSLEALKAASGQKGRVFVVTLKHPDEEQLGLNDLFEVGVLGRIIKVQMFPNGSMQALFEGESRGHLLSADFSGSYFTGRVKTIASRESADAEMPQLVKALKTEFFAYFEAEPKSAQSNWNENLNKKNVAAGRFADAVATYLNASIEEMQDILATLDTRERVEKVYTQLRREVRQRDFEKDLKARVDEQMSKRQKEFYLNEQMKAIQEELGEDERSEAQTLEEAINAAQMPAHVHEVATKELLKLKRMGNNSHEATPVRNYLDWLVSLPWTENTADQLSLAHAEAILNEDHYGLDKPKERILEFIAVGKAIGKLKGPIICLSGPPGVGKTSLARSIARALGRKYARISLGGVRDEAEIRGHRRTYIGALPGKILQTMKKVQTLNPLILLDEVDKISEYYRGGPTSALLEVLDPEQNQSFMDHYLEVEYDLSKVLFICTANDLSGVPWPLRDRMEIIELSGYTELEKLHIARRFLLPRQMEENGLKPGELIVNDQQILQIIRSYTREAGVRALERTLSKLCRKAVTERQKCAKPPALKLTARRTRAYLGVAPYQHNPVQRSNGVGMATGLAWTSVGGETLSIEVTTMRGSGKVQLTGKLGEVMQESAQAALSYVRSHANDLGIYSKVFKDLDIHIHLPAGGTPKDGPSAGIAIASAMVSALTGIPIHWNVGLTGEVTLRGNVLPIGGLKEKLLAAKRAMLRKVLIPVDNEKDLAEIPREITADLEIQTVTTIAEVFPILLERLLIPVNDKDLEPEAQNPMTMTLDPQLSNKLGGHTKLGVHMSSD